VFLSIPTCRKVTAVPRKVLLGLLGIHCFNIFDIFICVLSPPCLPRFKKLDYGVDAGLKSSPYCLLPSSTILPDTLLPVLFREHRDNTRVQINALNTLVTLVPSGVEGVLGVAREGGPEFHFCTPPAAWKA